MTGSEPENEEPPAVNEETTEDTDSDDSAPDSEDSGARQLTRRPSPRPEGSIRSPTRIATELAAAWC